METCILFFSISAILTVFSPTPFPIDEESVKYIKIEMWPSLDVIFHQLVILTPKYCAIIILSCDKIMFQSYLDPIVNDVRSMLGPLFNQCSTHTGPLILPTLQSCIAPKFSFVATISGPRYEKGWNYTWTPALYKFRFWSSYRKKSLRMKIWN